jgi:hypothetical protein
MWKSLKVMKRNTEGDQEEHRRSCGITLREMKRNTEGAVEEH